MATVPIQTQPITVKTTVPAPLSVKTGSPPPITVQNVSRPVAVEVAESVPVSVSVALAGQGPPGVPGPPGPGVSIKGNVATSADLPLEGNTVGDLWITEDSGHGWVWQEKESWLDVGPFQGPPGPIGPQGTQGVPGPVGPVGPSSPLTEAPVDGVAYGRRNTDWIHVLMASNDVVDGGNF